MSKRTAVQELADEENKASNTPRRSTRIAVTRRASTSEEQAPAKLTRAKRLSLSHESTAAKDSDRDDAVSVSSTASSQGRSTPKLQTTTRAASKSPQSKAKASEVKDGTLRRTRSRGSISNLADEDRVASPAPTRQTRQSSTRSESVSPTLELAAAAAKVSTPRRSTRSVSASPTSVVSVSKPRGRRPSVTDKVVPLESIEETESSSAKEAPALALTPIPKPRMLVSSVTETVVPLESIEETDSKQNKDSKEKTEKEDDKEDVSQKKKKGLLKEQNLQPITETSFIEETKSLDESSKEHADLNEKDSPSSSKTKSGRPSLSLIKSKDDSEETEEEKQLQLVLNWETDDKPSLRRSPRKSLNTSVSEPEKETPSKQPAVEITEEKKSSDTSKTSLESGDAPAVDATAGSEESFTSNLHVSESDVSRENLEAKANKKPETEVLNVSGSSNTSDKENQQLHALEAKASPKVTDSTKKKWLSEFNAQMTAKESPAKSLTENLNKSKSLKDKEVSFYEPMDVDDYPSDIEIVEVAEEGEAVGNTKEKSPIKQVIELSLPAEEVPPSTPKEDLSKTTEELEKSPSLLRKTSFNSKDVASPALDTSQKSPAKTLDNSENVLKIDISNESFDVEKPTVLTVSAESPKLSSPIRRSARLLKQTDSPGAETNIANSTPKQNPKQGIHTDESDVPVAEKLSSAEDPSNSPSKNTAVLKEGNSSSGDMPGESKGLGSANNQIPVVSSDPQENGTTEISEVVPSAEGINEVNGEAQSKAKDSQESEDDSSTARRSAKGKAVVDLDTTDSSIENLKEKNAEASFTNKSISKQAKLSSSETESDNKKSKQDEKSLEKYIDVDEEEDSDLLDKIKNLIVNRRQESSSSDEESVTHFLDDMAEEGEEDTPSEGSNDIIDEGESVGSTESEIDSDESYELDSFIDDNEDAGDLLSGDEFDLEQEVVGKPKKKRTRIIKPSDSEEEDKDAKEASNKKPSPLKETKSPAANKSFGQFVNNIPAEKPEKMRNGIEEDSDLEKMSTRPYCGLTPPSEVSLRDSLSDTEDNKMDEINDEESIVSVVINKEDNLKSLEEIQQQRTSDTFEKSVSQKSKSPPQNNTDVAKTPQNKDFSPAVIATTPNNSILEVPESNNSARKRLSSITIQENISLRDIEQGNISDRISQVVDIFCASVKKDGKDPAGNISLNISLDYLTNPLTDKPEDETAVEVTNEASKRKSIEKPDEVVENAQKVVDSPKNVSKGKAGEPSRNLSEVSAFELYSKSQNKKEQSGKRDKKRKRSISNVEEQKVGDASCSESTKPVQKKSTSASDSGMSEDLDKVLHEKYSSGDSDADLPEEIPIVRKAEAKKSKKNKKSKADTEDDQPTYKVKKQKKVGNQLKSNSAQADDLEETNTKEVTKKAKKHKKAKEVTDVEGKPKKTKKKSKLATDTVEAPTQGPMIPEIQVNGEAEYVSDEVFLEKLPKEKKKKSKKLKRLSAEEDEVPQSTKGKKKSRTERVAFKPEVSNIEYFPSSTLQELTKQEAVVASVATKSHKNKSGRKPKLVPSTSMGKRSWENEIVDTPVKPSTCSTSNAKRRKTDYSENFIQKDFRNRTLYDSTRVARMDTKLLLKKKQKMKY